MFRSYLLLVLTIVAGLSSTAYSAVAIEDLDRDSVSNAYAQLIRAEYQLLKSELAVEAKKSASFESLLANGHASWLENRRQKLVVDILNAKLAAYEQFESQAKTTLAGGEIKFESKFGSKKTDSNEMHLATIQELQKKLTSLRQAKDKLARAIATLPVDDPWVEGYRLRHAVAGHQTDVVAANIVLVERLHALRAETSEASEIVSATDQAATFTAAWKRPSKDSNSMQLLITQAELQIQLSQHHLLKETRRLASLQELVGEGMVTERSLVESKNQVDAIRELLKEQQDNLSWLRKDLDTSPDTDLYYTSVEVSGGNAIPHESSAALVNLPVLPSVLKHFELGQANYLRQEAILKGEMYREILSNLEQSIATQERQATFDRTSSKFSNVLISGQYRELEQYRWKIKKTELQLGLADAQVALLKEAGASQTDNLNMLVSTGISSSTPVTLPSRFHSSDPFGLQTTYSAFVYNSPVFKARRPALATRADLSASFRPVINRDALSHYRDLQSSRLSTSYGGFNRVHSFGNLNPGYRRAGQPPWYLPGSPLGSGGFGASRFGSSSHSNSFGRSSQHLRSTRSGYYGR